MSALEGNDEIFFPLFLHVGFEEKKRFSHGGSRPEEALISPNVSDF